MANEATGPDEITLGRWKYVGESEVLFETWLFNKIVLGGVPDDWRNSLSNPIL